MSQDMKYFDLIAKVHEIFAMDPTPGIQFLEQILGKKEDLWNYVFSKLDRADWLEHLDKHSYFSSPPMLEKGSKDGEILARRWPQAQYLSVLAGSGDKSIQKMIIQIMLRVGYTDNYWVHSQLAEACLKLPHEFASQWAQHEAEWLKKGNKTFGIIEKEFGSLISKLANERELTGAMDLARALLEVLPDPKAQEKITEKDDLSVRLEPAIRCDRYNYEQVLQENIPDLVAAASLQTFEMLCGLLQKAIEYSIKKDVEESKGLDFTPVWRPTIEDHAQNHDFHISCPLIVAVRDAAEKICKEAPSELPRILQSLEARRWTVFQRIALYLLTQSEFAPIELVRERLVNEENFNSTQIHHEYFHFMRKHFGRLSSDEKQVILTWIEEASKSKEYLAEYEPELPEEYKKKRIKWWQYEKLIPIQEYLEGEWKVRFEALAKELGLAHHPDFHFWMSGMITGPTSPKPVQKLAEMPLEELVDYLKNWVPPKEESLADEAMAPTPEGLGRELVKLVAEEPEKYASVIGKFMDPAMDRTFVRHLIHGFNDALKAQKAIPYEEVLALCQWVVDQPVGDKEAETRHFDQDLTWRYSRQAIGDLIEQFFLQGGNPAIELKEKIWAILKPLTADTEPDAAYEAKYGGKNMDHYTLSINTTRGKALHAMMHYALWLIRDIEKDTSVKAAPGQMPEIRIVWHEHLSKEDGSFFKAETDHAVFGYWLPLLTHLDPAWTVGMIPLAFPSKPEHSNLRLAAWSTFITYSQSSLGPTYGLLRDIYFEEVRALEGKVFERDDHRTPEFRLAEQVAALYAIGKASLDEGDLVEVFFGTAYASLTAHVIGYIGRSMTGKPHENQEELVARFKKLWEWRIKECKGIEKVPRGELAAFGWWFRAGKFGDEWALDWLEKVLKITGMGDITFHVVEQMRETILPHPMETLRCLKRIVEWWDDYWSLAPRPEAAAWQILVSALGHENREVRTLADEIVNLLGSKGLLKYGELLKKHRGGSQ